MRGGRRALRIGLKTAAIVACVAILARTFAGVDWRATWRVLRAAGPFAIAGLVPFGVTLLLDSAGVMLVARGRDLALRAATVLRVRVVSEALHYGAPGGVVASEAASIGMLVKSCGVTAKEAAAIAAGRKELVMRAHAAYLALGALASGGAFSIIARALHVRAPLALLGLASAAIPLAMSIALGATTRRVLPLPDGAKRSLQASVLGTLTFLAAWLVESVETAILATLVGAPLPMASVLAVEGVISMARSAVAFVPGGLGVQDVGYAGLLGALGVPQESAAAFVILKRAKELSWIAIGAIASVRSRRNDDAVDGRDVSTRGVRV